MVGDDAQGGGGAPPPLNETLPAIISDRLSLQYYQCEWYVLKLFSKLRHVLHEVPWYSEY